MRYYSTLGAYRGRPWERVTAYTHDLGLVQIGLRSASPHIRVSWGICRLFLDVIAYTCVWEHMQVVLGRTSPHTHVTWAGGYLQAGSWEHVTPAWRDHLDGQGCYPQAARTQGSKDGWCKALSKSRQARMRTSPHIRDTWCTTFGARHRIYM